LIDGIDFPWLFVKVTSLPLYGKLFKQVLQITPLRVALKRQRFATCSDSGCSIKHACIGCPTAWLLRACMPFCTCA
jgi:hypothetical protein